MSKISRNSYSRQPKKKFSTFSFLVGKPEVKRTVKGDNTVLLPTAPTQNRQGNFADKTEFSGI